MLLVSEKGDISPVVEAALVIGPCSWELQVCGCAAKAVFLLELAAVCAFGFNQAVPVSTEYCLSGSSTCQICVQAGKAKMESLPVLFFWCGCGRLLENSFSPFCPKHHVLWFPLVQTTVCHFGLVYVRVFSWPGAICFDDVMLLSNILGNVVAEVQFQCLFARSFRESAFHSLRQVNQVYDS